jgi:rod shape-determining protein MreC
MPLGTLDRTPPPFFKQGPSALSKLMFFSALALFLMVADTRFKVTQPLRAAVATVLYPVQWLVMRPVLLARAGGEYFESLQAAQQGEQAAQKRLALQSLRALQVEQLTLENNRLRKLLELRQQISTPAQAAEVLYDAADPYSRKIIIDKGSAQGIVAGSPVIDEAGVLGQVTRVLPLLSEVTLVIDRDQAIPVLNARTGVRGVAFGDPVSQGGMLDLRFMPGNTDVVAGDLLTTSGVDGVYPPGLPVARVARVERRADSSFARSYCAPQALVNATRDVMVLTPVAAQIPQRPAPPAQPASAQKKGSSK